MPGKLLENAIPHFLRFFIFEAIKRLFPDVIVHCQFHQPKISWFIPFSKSVQSLPMEIIYGFRTVFDFADRSFAIGADPVFRSNCVPVEIIRSLQWEVNRLVGQSRIGWSHPGHIHACSD